MLVKILARIPELRFEFKFKWKNNLRKIGTQFPASWVATQLIKDYDLGLNYHPGKANVVADALGCRSYCTSLMSSQPGIFEDLMDADIEIIPQGLS